MRVYYTLEVEEAVAFATAGGQALHLHRIVFPTSPPCFRQAVARGEPIAHLFDQDRDRLLATARKLGVRVLVVDRDGTDRQHVDLCAGPLKKAYAMLAGEQVQKLARVLASLKGKG